MRLWQTASATLADSFSKAHAIDAVVEVMRAHVGNAGVLEQACWAMQNIIVNGVCMR